MRTARNILIGVVLVLVLIGSVMLLSTSILTASVRHDDPYFFLKRHAAWLIISSIAALIAIKIDYKWLGKCSFVFWGIILFLLALVRMPGIGKAINGSWRWLSVGPVMFQPSEFAKLGAIILLAQWYKKNRRKAAKFGMGFFYPGSLFALGVVAIFFGPDYGTTMLIGCVGAMMMDLAGVRFGYLGPTCLLGMMAIAGSIVYNPERKARIMAFLDIADHISKDGWQLGNSLIAINNAGIWGVGLGESIQKRFYLPEAHTDFVFAILAEELGLFASSAVVLLYVALYICGTTIALKTTEVFGRLMAFGITLMITVQAIINLCVVTGCMPTKGLALPFVSYGGSSLLVNTVMVALLVNLANKGIAAEE